MSLTTGLHGCWSPSLGATGYTLRGFGPIARHGELRRMAASDWQATSRGLALQFRASAFTNVDIAFPVTLGNSFTVAFWFRFSSTSGSKYLLNVTTGTASDPTTELLEAFSVVYGFVGTNILEMFSRAFTGTDPRANSQMTIADTDWHLVCYSYNGQTWCGTLDGRQQFSVSRTFSINTAQQIRFGGGYANVAWWDGNGGEFAVYSRGLTIGEQAELYRRGNGWLGRELTGQNVRRIRGKAAGFKAAWARRQNQIIGGGL